MTLCHGNSPRTHSCLFLIFALALVSAQTGHIFCYMLSNQVGSGRASPRVRGINGSSEMHILALGISGQFRKLSVNAFKPWRAYSLILRCRALLLPVDSKLDIQMMIPKAWQPILNPATYMRAAFHRVSVVSLLHVCVICVLYKGFVWRYVPYRHPSVHKLTIPNIRRDRTVKKTSIQITPSRKYLIDAMFDTAHSRTKSTRRTAPAARSPPQKKCTVSVRLSLSK
jgi:hypothetical protein